MCICNISLDIEFTDLFYTVISSADTWIRALGMSPLLIERELFPTCKINTEKLKLLLPKAVWENLTTDKVATFAPLSDEDAMPEILDDDEEDLMEFGQESLTVPPSTDESIVNSVLASLEETRLENPEGEADYQLQAGSVSPTVIDPAGRKIFKSTLCQRLSLSARTGKNDSTKLPKDRLSRVSASTNVEHAFVPQKQQPDSKESLEPLLLCRGGWAVFVFETTQSSHQTQSKWAIGQVIAIRKKAQDQARGKVAPIYEVSIEDEALLDMCEVACDWFNLISNSTNVLRPEVGVSHQFYPASSVLCVLRHNGVLLERDEFGGEQLIVDSEGIGRISKLFDEFQAKKDEESGVKSKTDKVRKNAPRSKTAATSSSVSCLVLEAPPSLYSSASVSARGSTEGVRRSARSSGVPRALDDMVVERPNRR
jgi:hypothetical protein